MRTAAKIAARNCVECAMIYIAEWGRAGSTGGYLCRIAGRGATHLVKSGKKITGNSEEYALAA